MLADVARTGIAGDAPDRGAADDEVMKTAVKSPDRGAQSQVPAVSAFDKRVIVVGGILFAVLMALSARYGFDRDELYFLDCARHLQASYVDQPVLAPLLAWVSLKLFGVSLAGLRVWPALAAWATVVIGGLTAREFGGGRRAQLLAAVGDRHDARALLAADHLAGPTAFDMLAWAGPGADRRPGRAHRRLPLVAGRRADPGPRAGQQAQRGLLRRRAVHRRAAVRRPRGWC